MAFGGGIFQKAGKMFGLRSRANQLDLSRGFSGTFGGLQGGHFTFDPSIRKIQDESLASLRGLLGEATGSNNAFIQARVNPLKQRISQNRGSLQRSLGQRGVFGSFANQDRNNFEFDAQRALGDAGALATNESFASRKAIIDAIQGIGDSRASLGLQGTQLGLSSILGLQGTNLGAAALQDAAGARAGKLLEKIISAISPGGGGGFGGGG